MSVWQWALGLALLVAAAAGGMALYAREVRRDRDAMWVFILTGVASVVAAAGIGWVFL